VLVLVGVDVLIGATTTVEIVVIVLDASATTEVVPNSLQLLKPVVGLNLLEEIVRLTVTLVPAALLGSLAENTGRGVNVETVESVAVAAATHVRSSLLHHGVELDEPVNTLTEFEANLALQARADLGVDVIPRATDALADEAFERGVVPALGLVIPPVTLMHPFVLREIDVIVF
jgi:hypothetical protein